MRASVFLIPALVIAAPVFGQTAPNPLRLTLDEAVTRGLATSHRIAEAVAHREAADAVVGERHAAALTLEEAIERGLATSHRLAEAAARGDAAEAVAGERHAALRPQVAAQAGYTRTNHVDEFGILLPNNQVKIIYPDVPDNYRSRLDLQWPIYTGGRVDALERAARIEATASADEIATARADLRLEIARAYWTLVTSTESLRVVEEAVGRIDAHLRDVRNQLTAGLIPPSDVLTVEAQQSRQRMFAIQARVARDAFGGWSTSPGNTLTKPPLGPFGETIVTFASTPLTSAG